MANFNSRLRQTLIVAVLLLPACAYPPYKFAPGEKSAQLQSLTNSQPTLCVDGKLYDLIRQPKDKFYLIPVGKPMTISTSVSYDVYPYIYTCYPRLGFEPEEGRNYLWDVNVVDNACLLEIVQTDAYAPSGLIPDFTIGPANCFYQEEEKPAKQARSKK